jgi:Cu+-exporting ATPase
MNMEPLRYACDRGGEDMEKDVVCGMQVDPAKAAGASELNGKTFYFCSKGCKAKFDANPGQFTK